MANNAVDRFLQTLAMDVSLQDDLVQFGLERGLEPGRGRLDEQAIVDFAARHGFRLTVDDLVGRDLAAELSGQATAPLTALPKPGPAPARPSSEWWAWLQD